MVRELDEMGVKLMVSVWPSVSPVSENYHPMLDRGFFIGTEFGPMAHADWPDKGLGAYSAQVAFYDATNPEAREYVWERIRRGYHELGIKVFWLDAGEPELKPGHQYNLRYHAGPGLEVRGAVAIREVGQGDGVLHGEVPVQRRQDGLRRVADDAAAAG